MGDSKDSSETQVPIPVPTPSPTPAPVPEPNEPKEITSWRYQLQNYNSSFVNRVAATTDAMWIIDKENSSSKSFEVFDVLKMKNGGVNTLISYISVGEAESYRSYFKDLPRSVLGTENPNWPGNYNVEYWTEEWHQVIYKSDDSYLLQILNAGFDGVYLDVVDAYKRQPDLRRAAADMARLVMGISERAKAINPDFRIYLQNGSEIINDIDASLKGDFIEAINGLSVEGYFFDYSKNGGAQKSPWFKELEPVYREYQRFDKEVFMIEYVEDSSLQQEAIDYCNKNDIKLLITDRLLEGAFFINN